jgi:hypothetical protein
MAQRKGTALRSSRQGRSDIAHSGAGIPSRVPQPYTRLFSGGLRRAGILVFGGTEGFWEWKGPVIRESGCAYGKLLGGRAAFLTLDWYREFANYRRDGYDFDARCDEGLVRSKDKQVFDVLWEHGSLLSKELNRMRSGGGKRKDFDTIMTRLQMLGYVVISNFEYEVSRRGEAYCWGITRYENPGKAFRCGVYRFGLRARARGIEADSVERLQRLLPDTEEKAILKLLG